MSGLKILITSLIAAKGAIHLFRGATGTYLKVGRKKSGRKGRTIIYKKNKNR